MPSRDLSVIESELHTHFPASSYLIGFLFPNDNIVSHLAIFCLFLLKDYSLFNMHGMEDSPPTFSSEKYYGLQIVVMTTSSLRLQGVPQNKSPHLRSHHSCGSPCPGTDIRSYPNPVIEDSPRDRSAIPHGLQGSPCAWPRLCWGRPKV